MNEILSNVIDWYMSNINYWTIALLMAVESSFIPFPSEIVVPPAAWKAARGELNIWLVLLSSTSGAMIGAVFNYFIALFIGRRLVYKLAGMKFARLLLITPESVKKAEDYFIRNGKISTFIGRLIPAIRQLISLPAGFAKMRMTDFLLYTALGATIWNAILAMLGYFLYSQKEKLELYYYEISWGFLILGALFVIYLLYKAFRKDNSNVQ